ncbi:MAG: hypothetical protein ACOY42_12280 [Pseudomonadota bacterium]
MNSTNAVAVSIQAVPAGSIGVAVAGNGRANIGIKTANGTASALRLRALAEYLVTKCFIMVLPNRDSWRCALKQRIYPGNRCT